MDVILTQDVEKLGVQGSIVHVKPGFARNFLVPQGLALMATSAQVKTIEEITRQRRRKIARAEAESQAIKAKLEKHSLEFKLTLGEDDKAFGSITAHDVLETLVRDGFTVEKHAVHLPQPIKSLGVHEVPVKLHANVTAVLKVRVVKA